jgi:hypothetical protein
MFELNEMFLFILQLTKINVTKPLLESFRDNKKLKGPRFDPSKGKKMFWCDKLVCLTL